MGKSLTSSEKACKFFSSICHTTDRTMMVFKDSQANLEAAFATFVIGDLGRKSGRSNQGSEVTTIDRTMSAFPDE